MGFPGPTQGDDPGIEPRSPALQVDSLPAKPQGKPQVESRDRDPASQTQLGFSNHFAPENGGSEGGWLHHGHTQHERCGKGIGGAVCVTPRQLWAPPELSCVLHLGRRGQPRWGLCMWVAGGSRNTPGAGLQGASWPYFILFSCHQSPYPWLL